ncbi:VCBS repeat-containing protein [Actinokineospora sp. UTMC 2448]|uniref:FG-GAP repeat domain-containing protein n=1 Tax=Actinokineospora sp. UTMC 2448 TaxID=2268449 RepID=UPI0021641078|nr:VCBS repeat-containing protein [Actinokineospora sp. UTMC 2448]
MIAGLLAGAALSTGTAAARPGDAPTADDMTIMCTVPANHDPAVIAAVYRVGDRLDVSGKVMLAGFEAGWVESHMNNLNCGDRDSLGVFQQRPSMGWGTVEQIMNVEYAANSFFTRAIASERDHPGFAAWEIAQDVQRSCCPLRYRDAEAKAVALIAEAKPAARHTVDGSDISGDGHADMLGVKPDGTLLYYGNNINANPGDPFSGSGAQVGSGFGVFDWVDGADLSGDGSADLLARKPDGTLWYYPNNRYSNPGNVPFAGSGTQVGHGFQNFDRLDAADIDGDGDADLLGRRSDGTLWFYRNYGTGGGDPFDGGGAQIGSGFGVFDWFDGADISGDGHADLIARKPDGTLWYYANNSGSNPGGVPFAGTGTQIGSGFGVFDIMNAADISGDGSADLFARKPDGTLFYYANNRYHNPGNLPFVGSGLQIGQGFQVFSKLM